MRLKPEKVRIGVAGFQATMAVGQYGGEPTREKPGKSGWGLSPIHSLVGRDAAGEAERFLPKKRKIARTAHDFLP